MYRNSVTKLVLHSKDFHTNKLKEEEKCKFFLADFLSISANYGAFDTNIGVLKLDMYRNSVTTLVLHSKGISHKLAKKRRKMQVTFSRFLVYIC